jgi:hypothetical protein
MAPYPPRLTSSKGSPPLEYTTKRAKCQASLRIFMSIPRCVLSIGRRLHYFSNFLYLIIIYILMAYKKVDRTLVLRFVMSKSLDILGVLWYYRSVGKARAGNVIRGNRSETG